MTIEMGKKLFILSSTGLKNIVANQNYEDDFKFIFGEHEIQMQNLFAEFVSPYVSQIHQSDPTITSLDFSSKNSTNLSKMSEEIFSLFESISKGDSIYIDKEQCFHLQIISLLIKNKEMFSKLDELFENEDDEKIEEKIKEKLEFVSFFEKNPESSEILNTSVSIEFIASNFYSIEIDQIINLPKTVFYSILTNQKLTIESEDWLLEVIDKFVSKEETEKGEFSKSDGLSNASLYEEVNFDYLSEDKFQKFIEKFDVNEMTVSLWNKIKKCFYFNKKTSNLKSHKICKRDGNGFYRHIQRYSQSIIVGGRNSECHFGDNSTNKKKSSHIIIYPPQNLQLNPSSLLSYSAYYGHSIAVTRSGSLMGIGHNCSGRIGSSLPKTVIRQFQEFSMNDSSGQPMTPISAACTLYGTLYLSTKSCGRGKQLVCCDCRINEGASIFLDIGSHEPVSLFFGKMHTASICSDGEVIFVNSSSVAKSPSSRITASSLPGGEKATMVALTEHSVFALSSTGRVFKSGIESGSCILKFSEVSELSGQEIVWLSGTDNHCLAVSSECRVFGVGSNRYGELGVGKEISQVPSFTEISSLSGYRISAAYAGSCFSLFETREGKILSCGYNYFGELLLSSGPSDENVYYPTETAITKGATFCIAGENMSAVFIDGDPPPNTPNTRVHYQH